VLHLVTHSLTDALAALYTFPSLGLSTRAFVSCCCCVRAGSAAAILLTSHSAIHELGYEFLPSQVTWNSSAALVSSGYDIGPPNPNGGTSLFRDCTCRYDDGVRRALSTGDMRPNFQFASSLCSAGSLTRYTGPRTRLDVGQHRFVVVLMEQATGKEGVKTPVCRSMLRDSRVDADANYESVSVTAIIARLL
jgi:hypothetical protein